MTTQTNSTSEKDIIKARLTETMVRLAQSIHTTRTAALRSAGILAIARDRIVADDERAYEAALTSYRALTHPHASTPAGCRLY